MGYSLYYITKIAAVVARDVLFFPIWWYSLGAINLIIGIKNFLVGQAQMMAIMVWIKNIFKPMYAQSDWQGRIISFFMRLVQIILRSIMMAVWFLIAFFVFIAWLMMPLIIIINIYKQLK
ncbi:MAG: hypothetical protein Q8Q23_06080 [bacterium]|nr:hypothetical protein [bacterium]